MTVARTSDTKCRELAVARTPKTKGERGGTFITDRQPENIAFTTLKSSENESSYILIATVRRIDSITKRTCTNYSFTFIPVKQQ